MSPLRGSPGGHGGAYGAGLPRLARASPCLKNGNRRRPLAPVIGQNHAAGRDGVGSGRIFLRSSHASVRERAASTSRLSRSGRRPR